MNPPTVGAVGAPCSDSVGFTSLGRRAAWSRGLSDSHRRHLSGWCAMRHLRHHHAGGGECVTCVEKRSVAACLGACGCSRLAGRGCCGRRRSTHGARLCVCTSGHVCTIIVPPPSHHCSPKLRRTQSTNLASAETRWAHRCVRMAPHPPHRSPRVTRDRCVLTAGLHSTRTLRSPTSPGEPPYPPIQQPRHGRSRG
jgi:hypothetical protein